MWGKIKLKKIMRKKAKQIGCPDSPKTKNPTDTLDHYYRIMQLKAAHIT